LQTNAIPLVVCGGKDIDRLKSRSGQQFENNGWRAGGERTMWKHNLKQLKIYTIIELSVIPFLPSHSFDLDHEPSLKG